MDYMAIKVAAKKWGITPRRVQTLCMEGRLDGATKIGNAWAIPVNTPKPDDGRYKATKKQFTSIDLFCGPGGLATGFRWAGIKALIAVEWSYWTVQTYSRSHDAEVLVLDDFLKKPEEEQHFKKSDKTLLIHGDIRLVTNKLLKQILQERFGVDSVDIVTGGAPCESFSMAGDRKEEDYRNELYTNVLRIARGVDSKMFMFENVKGLFSKKHEGVKGKMYEAICADFQKEIPGRPSFKLAETDPTKVLLKAVEYGVPQMRERLFLIGINRKYPNGVFTYPEKTHGPNKKYHYVTVEDAIMDLPQIDSGIEATAYDFDIKSVTDETRLNFLKRVRGDLSMAPQHTHFNGSFLCSHKGPGHTSKMLTRIHEIKQGEGMKAAYERLMEEGKTELASSCFPNKIYAARNRRLRPDSPSFTVTSHCLDEMLHPYLDRALTPREAARLQSFPDWYQFQGPYVKFHSDPEQDQYEQIGDAIPPLLAYALGKEIVKTLSNIDD